MSVGAFASRPRPPSFLAEAGAFSLPSKPRTPDPPARPAPGGREPPATSRRRIQPRTMAHMVDAVDDFPWRDEAGEDVTRSAMGRHLLGMRRPLGIGCPINRES